MPVLDPDHARALAADLRRRGRRVVFADGVYDLLHPGHVRYLHAARAEGDALIVGVLSDRCARERRGPSRPITPQRERAEIVAALGAVDAAVLVDEDPPRSLIAALEPAVVVIRANGSADGGPAPDAAESAGPCVIRLPVEQSWSTRSIIESIQRTTRP